MSELSEDPPPPPARASGAPGRSRRGRRWIWWAAGTLAVVLAVVVLVLLLWPGTTWWVEHVDGVELHCKRRPTGGKDCQGVLTGKDRQEALDNARGRITAVATGILAAVAIYYTANNAHSARQTAQAALRSADHNEAAQRRTHELTERGQLTDRFTAAVAQLGDTNPAVQLGGVHALAGLADDAPTRALRQTCIDVLCAYLRLPYDPDPGPLDQPDTPTADQRDAHQQRRAAYRGLREVRHTIIRLIGNHLRLPSDDPRSWQGHDFDFTDAVLDGGDLYGAHFSTGTTATFTRATFTHDFDFGGAEFTGGEVTFESAKFTGGEVTFRYAKFSSGIVDFESAEFTGGEVTFRYAKFTGGTVDFGGAEFTGGEVTFEIAEFTGGTVNFGYAKFSSGIVDFESAEFTGGTVNFGYAKFTGGTVTFRYAEFTGGTVTFRYAEFTGGTVRFEVAEFTGGTVTFRYAKFTGGEVTFESAKFTGGEVTFRAAEFTGDFLMIIPDAEGVMPAGLLGADGRPAAGVLLPDEWLPQAG